MTRRNKWFLTISILLTVGMVAISAIWFRTSYIRLWETLCDLWSSIKFYFFTIFDPEKAVGSTVTDLSDVLSGITQSPPTTTEPVPTPPAASTGPLPNTFEEFMKGFVEFFRMFFSKENFSAFMVYVGKGAKKIAKVLLVAMPLVIVAILIMKKMYGQYNTKHNQSTIPLRLYLIFEMRVIRPIIREVKLFIAYVQERTYWKYIWGSILFLSLNLASTVVAIFAFYFYFVISFDIGNLYTQVRKLIMDLQIPFEAIPIIFWIILAWILFCKYREKRGLSKLRHHEARNCGFINELPIVSMTCGSMGKKKTTMITDMALSQHVMFRQRALEGIQKFDMLFPNFPWICFEDEIKEGMEEHTIYHLASVRAWLDHKQELFENSEDYAVYLYGYDGEKYGMTAEDGLKTVHLFDALREYACFYFIYIIESSLIVSNYSIREDDKLMSAGNFPMWYSNFFPKGEPRDSHFSHILDFDTLRLGKKVIENNPHAGSFEFGVVCITEVGKERGNTLELKDVKKNDEEANQKNDLFNSWLKMCRHSATVDGFPFVKVFTDEQRPESWGADARDLCDIVHIVSSGERKCAMPFYFIEGTFSEWMLEKFLGWYYDFRFRRGDTTLLMYLLKLFTAFLYHRHTRILNRFGYSVLVVETERGTQDGKKRKKKYFLSTKKIYSRRFSTDCFSDYFEDKALETNIGLMDYNEYADEKATVDELKEQNSYFIRTLYGEDDGR